VQTVLEVKNVYKRFCRNPKLALKYAAADIFRDLSLRRADRQLRTGEFWALKDIGFQVKRGEVVGVIGNNGAGKSTLLNLVTGILRPTSGSVGLRTEKIISMGNQTDLNPVQTGRENIINKLAFYGMPLKEIWPKVERIIHFADIGEAMDAPTGSYSLGMRIRLSFAIYTCLRPDIFIVDEGLNGGDINFHRKFGQYLETYMESGGSMLLASHNLPLLQMLCHKCILLADGEVKAFGDPVEVIDLYQKLNGESALPGATDRMRLANSSLSQELSQAASDSQLQVVRFESLKVFALDGGPATSGKPAVFELECHATEDQPAVFCGIELGSETVFPLAVMTTEHSLHAGRNILKCTVDALTLSAGRYTVAAFAAHGKVGAMFGHKGYADKPFSFDVTSTPDELQNLARFKKCPLYLSNSWTVIDELVEVGRGR
jgi:lipopolysaccharide transport system ATP-binding protein